MSRVTVSAAGETVSVDYTLPGPASPLLAVRVFPTYSTKTYGNHAAVLNLLGLLGVKRISHLLTPTMPADVIEFTQDAAAMGILSWFTVGKPLTPLAPAAWTKIRNLLAGPLAGTVALASGWNEPNHIRGGGTLPNDWDTQAAAHQLSLWNNAHPLGIPVGTPQLWSGNLNTQFADLAQLAPKIQGAYDTITWHLYPRGGAGLDLLDAQEIEFRRLLGDHPIVCTESGYFTAPNYSGGSNPVTEAEQAYYLPELAGAYTSRGHGLSYFELLDDPDPSGTLREASFGLVRAPSLDPSTWSLKPAFHTFRDEITRMS